MRGLMERIMLQHSHKHGNPIPAMHNLCRNSRQKQHNSPYEGEIQCQCNNMMIYVSVIPSQASSSKHTNAWVMSIQFISKAAYDIHIH